MPSDAPQHWLVVTECNGDLEYGIEHDGDCPTEVWDSGLGGVAPVLEHTCGFDTMLHEGGIEHIPGGGKLGPGRYSVSIYTARYSTAYGVEWDAWLDLDAEATS